jgi:hypothetical protein
MVHKGDLANRKTSSVQYLLAASKLALELNVRVPLDAVVCFLGACGYCLRQAFQRGKKKQLSKLSISQLI